MTEHEARAAPRLRFSKEEIQPENLQITSAKTKKAMKKAVKPPSMTGKAPVQKTYVVFQGKSTLPLSDAPASRDTQHIADEENAFPAEESNVIEKVREFFQMLNTQREKAIFGQKKRNLPQYRCILVILLHIGQKSPILARRRKSLFRRYRKQ